jgi:RNA polymerase sigma-70 factor, ECF subfamily
MSVSEEVCDRDRDHVLEDARAGSPEALGRALEACRRYLLLVAEKELGRDLRARTGASDLVKETFLEAHRDFAQFHGNTPGEFRFWLLRILMHNVGAFMRQYRQTGKRSIAPEVGIGVTSANGAPYLDLATWAASPSAKVVAREHSQALRAALDRLPEDYRRVITLRYDEMLTFERIGREMGRSTEAARKVWSTAMEHLRDEWASSQ